MYITKDVHTKDYKKMKCTNLHRAMTGRNGNIPFRTWWKNRSQSEPGRSHSEPGQKLKRRIIGLSVLLCRGSDVNRIVKIMLYRLQVVSGPNSAFSAQKLTKKKSYRFGMGKLGSGALWDRFSHSEPVRFLFGQFLSRPR